MNSFWGAESSVIAETQQKRGLVVYEELICRNRKDGGGSGGLVRRKNRKQGEHEDDCARDDRSRTDSVHDGFSCLLRGTLVSASTCADFRWIHCKFH